MTALTLTASQTVGPFFHGALCRDNLNILAGEGTAGDRVRIEGRVLDGEGLPVADSLVEIWQANAHGRYNHPLDRRSLPLDPGFTGFGRAATDDNGCFWFETVKPGPVPFDAAAWQAPHLNLIVHARGLLNHLPTRLYFEGEPANAADPVLLRVPASRRQTLVAQRRPGDGGQVYHLDIVLQGAGETVFFNL